MSCSLQASHCQSFATTAVFSILCITFIVQQTTNERSNPVSSQFGPRGPHSNTPPHVPSRTATAVVTGRHRRTLYHQEQRTIDPVAADTRTHPTAGAQTGSMPALRALYQRAASTFQAADLHILNSRQPIVAQQQAQAAHHILETRQSGQIVAIPTVYQGLNSGPAPATVVGIVLGSVLGFLLIMWLLWTVSNGNGGAGFIRTSRYDEESVVEVRRRNGSRRSQRTEMTSRSPARSVRRERVIRQERIVRDVREPRAPSRIRETIIVDEGTRQERRVDGDDIVEVIEEHDSSVGGGVPRRKSKRAGGGGGYRLVDPGAFAGGGYAQRKL